MTSPQARGFPTETKAPAENAAADAVDASVVIAELEAELATLRARHRPEVARMLVGLGTDLTGVVTLGTLESGIAYALGR